MKIIINTIIILILISSCGKYGKKLFIEDRKERKKNQSMQNVSNNSEKNDFYKSLSQDNDGGNGSGAKKFSNPGDY